MPYGHIEQYLDLLERAQKQRIEITKKQKQQIVNLYTQVANDLEKELKKYHPLSLDYRWLKDYAKSLRQDSKLIHNELKNIITGNMYAIATANANANITFFSQIVPQLSERFKDVFSTAPQSAVNELISGSVYKDFRGLSERIWDYTRQYNRDIQAIINQGIIAQKPAYDLAKDLESFLNPKAKLPFDWGKVYPGSKRVVDYNAQRLARTSVTHAYQMSMIRDTKDNPFVEKYRWLSSNAGRTCSLCASRDGELFDKDNVPYDHPNGMCVLEPVVTKSYDEIAKELRDWVNGEENTALDRWLNHGSENDIIKLYKKTRNTGVFSELPERMSKKHIREVAKNYNIDLKGITLNIDENVELLRIQYSGRADSEGVGGITFFPNAFRSKEELLRTIYHEKEHVNQYKTYGVKWVQENRGHFENLAYIAEDSFIEKLKKEGAL